MSDQKRNGPFVINWIFGGFTVGVASFYGVLFLANADIVPYWLVSDSAVLFYLFVGALIGLFGYLRSRSKANASPSHIETEPSETKLAPHQHAKPEQRITIFLSYRRDDSADVTGRIYDRLSSRFGTEKVFKDVDSIPLGRDFRDIIGNAIAKASVVIVVVGRNWMGSNHDSSIPSIHNPNDFVRTEVISALQQDKPVIPVLVSNAKMPLESELPDDLKAFAYRNGINVRPDPDFGNDVERLIRGIEQV